jgi:TetR/AcrR family transcriptional regulator
MMTMKAPAKRASSPPESAAKPIAKLREPIAEPRKPGRPVSEAGSPTQRERLIDTALELFAEHGAADTTLAAIAREAGVTPAMMSYYFKTRDQLIDVLLEERFLPVRAAIGGIFEANADDPVAAISQLAQRLVDVATAHPWFPAIWMRGVISGGGLFKQRMEERYGSADRKKALQCIARWQQEGRMNAELEPSLLFLSLLGLTILPLTAIKTWADDPVRKQIGAADIARHAIALLVHGVSP